MAYPRKLRIIPFPDTDGSDAAAAHLMTVGRDSAVPFYRVFVTVNGSTFLVKKDRDLKTVIQISGNPPYDFIYTPVGNAIPPEPEDVVLDYRNGASRTKVTQADVEAGTYPLLSLGDYLPGNQIAHVTIDGDTEQLKTFYTKNPCGTSTWYGDTPNVISWHGIGSMDAAGNDFREYYNTAEGRYYTTPAYEAEYFSDYRGHAAPEAATHLAGDKYFINPATDADLKHGRCVIYRNGYRAATADWPILAACEVKDQDYETNKKLWLKVLTGRWFSTPEQFNPIQYDGDYVFESYGLNGFYLFEEGPNGWALRIIDIPPVEEGAPTTSLIAQAPQFSADGMTIAGIVETAYDLVLPGAYQYYESRLINKTQAWIFAIDTLTAAISLVSPASTVRVQKDYADSGQVKYSSWERNQTLSIYPAQGGYNKLIRTDAVVITKDRPDAAAQWVPNEVIFPWHNTRAEAEAFAEQFFSSIQAAALQQVRAAYNVWQEGWYGAGNYDPLNYPDAYIEFRFVAGAPNTNSTYSSRPAGGSTGTVNVGVGINIQSGAIQCSDWYSPAYYFEGYQIPAATYNRSQKTITVTSGSFDVYGTQAGVTSKTDTVITEGWGSVYAGAGVSLIPDSAIVIYSVESSGFYGYINLLNDLSFELEYRAASTVLGPDAPTYRVVAADPRKSAAILKNLTAGGLIYIGVRSGD